VNRFSRAVSCVVVVLALTVSVGCSDNIALVGRPMLQLDQEEIFAEIDRVDTSSREIHLRTDEGRNRVVAYSADARVLYRGREYPIAQLEGGDKVSMQLKQDSRGKSYTDLIRVQEKGRDQSRGRISSGIGIQTVDGQVEQVDFQRSSFEIREHSSERIFVSLPDNARRSDLDLFHALRSGDYVRVEGRFTSNDRFELESFLRNNR
jgi:hypothetical protein